MRRLTARELNRATLHRQLLLARGDMSTTEGVRQVAAIQAQDPATPYIALWNRLKGFEPADLDHAFAGRTVVKASLMRITLHVVDAADYPVFYAAMRPSLRASRLFDRRFKQTGLVIADLDALEPGLLAGGSAPRTSPEMTAILEQDLGEWASRAWWAYRTYAPFHHAPTGGPWSFGPRSAFVAAPTTLPPGAHEASVDGLVRRYLQAFGPAGTADVARFSLLTRAVVRRALERLGDQLVRLEGSDGIPLYDVAGREQSLDAPAPPRLLPMWDSVLLAYADRDRVLPPAYRPWVIRRNGDVLATVLVDGHVAGAWRHEDGRIEVKAFEPLDRDAWAALADEAAALLAMLQPRDPSVYRRYRHWWGGLPAAEVRLLPG